MVKNDRDQIRQQINLFNCTYEAESDEENQHPSSRSRKKIKTFPRKARIHGSYRFNDDGSGVTSSEDENFSSDLDYEQDEDEKEEFRGMSPSIITDTSQHSLSPILLPNCFEPEEPMLIADNSSCFSSLPPSPSKVFGVHTSLYEDLKSSQPMECDSTGDFLQQSKLFFINDELPHSQQSSSFLDPNSYQPVIFYDSESYQENFWGEFSIKHTSFDEIYNQQQTQQTQSINCADNWDDFLSCDASNIGVETGEGILLAQ